MKDREFILKLKKRCEQYVESFEKITEVAGNDEVARFSAVGNRIAYEAVSKMIEVYLEEQDDENIKNNSR